MNKNKSKNKKMEMLKNNLCHCSENKEESEVEVLNPFRMS